MMNGRRTVSQNQGVIAIVVALALVPLLGFAALVIDLGFGLVTRHQLQNITDSASLAGTRQLGRIYEGLTDWQQQGYVLTSADKSAIIDEVQEMGEKNAAGGKFITINPEDIQIGHWNIVTRQLTPTYESPDAVQVLARRDDQANDPLTTFFAGIVGTDSLQVVAQATAALTGINKVTADELGAPIGILLPWFSSHGNFCDASIQFSPTNSPDGCAGWHTFYEEPNAHSLRHIIDGLRTGSFVSPGATAGETQFNFIGGEVASVFNRFQRLYDAKAVCSTTGEACSDGSCDGTCEWSTLVGVYDYPSCSNPSGSLTVVGFATTTIYEVQGPPDRIVRARVACDRVQPDARGGGANFGTKGSIPGLVQ